jgi:23S rRNA (guanosine2251-2'-O)-methyltransferase
MMTKRVVLILDNLRSVENTGSMFRTAEGLGVEKIYLIGTTPTPVDRFGRKRDDFSKVALGAESLVSWEHFLDIKIALEKLKEEKFQIIALEQAKEAKNLKNYESKGNLALLVGNEVEGVSAEALKLADEVVEIKMVGGKESLNVSVATGIALFQLLK